MIDTQNAETLVTIARNALDRGKELEPHTVGELEKIAADVELPRRLRIEAIHMLRVERGA